MTIMFIIEKLKAQSRFYHAKPIPTLANKLRTRCVCLQQRSKRQHVGNLKNYLQSDLETQVTVNCELQLFFAETDINSRHNALPKINRVSRTLANYTYYSILKDKVSCILTFTATKVDNIQPMIAVIQLKVFVVSDNTTHNACANRKYINSNKHVRRWSMEHQTKHSPKTSYHFN